MADPFPFVASTVLTAAQLNGIGEAWTSYTPTVTQGVGVTCTVNYAKYARVNKIIHVSVALQFTSAGTANSSIVVSLPVTAAAGTGAFGNSLGAGGFFDLSALAQYSGSVQQNGTTGMSLYSDQASGGGSFLGQFPAVTIANGDYMFLFATYQAA